MKNLVVAFIMSINMLCANAFAQELTQDNALNIVNETLQETEGSGGLHSLDMFSMKHLGERSKILADDWGIHYEQVYSDEKKDKILSYDELKKIVVLIKEKAQYGPHWIGDYHLLLHSKKVGKLLIVGVTEEQLYPFINALKVLAPNMKKVNHAY